MRMGSNDTSHVVWAIGESFYFLHVFFTKLFSASRTGPQDCKRPETGPVQDHGPGLSVSVGEGPIKTGL